MANDQIDQMTGWQQFWHYTRTYYTLQGMADSADRMLRCYGLPDPLPWVAEKIGEVLSLVLACLVVALIMFPLSTLRMLWFTPRRFKLTILAARKP